MTKMKCPWCGGDNLKLVDIKCGYQTRLRWEDKDCGYRQNTDLDGKVTSRRNPRQRLVV